MKRIFTIFFLALMMHTPSAAAEKSLGVEEYTSVDELASAITAYFPKIQGEVKVVQGDRLTIALGTKDGLVPGVTLSLWRDGREILHPATKAVIGRVEDEVGSAEVISLTEKTCIAIQMKTLKDAKSGDKARITPKKISLAVLPVRADRPDIIQNLMERLNDSGRFTLLDAEKTALFLKDKKQRDASVIREMSKAFALEVIAAVGIYPAEGGKLLITTKMFYADEARPLDTSVALLDLKAKKDVFGEVKPFFAPVVEEKSSVTELPFEAQLFTAADLDNSGATRYVFSDGVRLHVYRQVAAGWREEWAEQTVPGDDIQHINLDVADINGNGRPQIFVTSMKNSKVVSFVMEYQEGLYHRIAEVPGFLRVIRHPAKGTVLIGQAYDSRTFFSGPVYQYRWVDGRYAMGQEFPLPNGVGLYGFVFANSSETNPLLVALDAKDQLVVYSGDSRIWKSEERYPFVGVAVSKPATDAVAVISQSVADAEKSEKVRIKGRVLALDLNGDGKDEIILPKNASGSALGEISRAEIVSLGWTGVRLEQRWAVPDVPGAVLDVQIARQGSGAQILALVKSPGGLFARDNYRVMTFTAK